MADTPHLTMSLGAAENLVALSEKFHTHLHFRAFYDRYSEQIGGFTGCYDIIIRMADTLCEWENRTGNTMYDNVEVVWDELMDKFVAEYFDTALADENWFAPNPETVFQKVEPETGATDAIRPANSNLPTGPSPN